HPSATPIETDALYLEATSTKLRQIILNLQINSPGNMAILPDVLNSMASLLAQIPQYVSQELPDDYYNKVMQVINYGHSLGVAVFNDGVKTNVLAGKMAGRFTPSNPFNNNAEIAVATPALFIA
ncbi:7931_t:CDS:2, partial [Funneliformis geosporum]